MFSIRESEHYDYPQLCIFQDEIVETKFLEFFKNKISYGSKSTVLYIHIPFCRKVCIFCNYLKEKPTDEIINRYLSSLKTEIDYYSKNLPQLLKNIDAIHIGGGTPTTLSIAQLDDLLQYIDSKFSLTESCLFSIEANITDLLDRNYVFGLSETMINRVSFGIQSFSSLIRKKYGLTNVSIVYEAIDNLQDSKINNYNADIMYNFPEQTVDDVIKDIEISFQQEINCIDLYSLNVFPNTNIHKFLLRNGTYQQYQNNLINYLALYDYINKHDDINLIMSNTISKRSCEPNQFIKAHLGFNQINGGTIIGLGASSRGYLEGYAYKNAVGINDYILKTSEQQHARQLETVLSNEEILNRTLVMFPNFTYVNKNDVVLTPENKMKLEKLLITNVVYEKEDQYRISKSNCFWAGNISASFYSNYQKSKMTKAYLYNMKSKLNLYNQDKMQIKENKDGMY